MMEILPSDYYDSILSEYPSMSMSDLKNCVDISITQYFSCEHAFIVNDFIYTINNKNIHTLERKHVRTKELKVLIERNFHLMQKLRSTNISPQYLKDNNLVLYAKKDLENEDFLLYSLFFKKKNIEGIKAIIYKNDLISMKYAQALFDKEVSSITLNLNNINRHEGIFIIGAELLNRNIIIHELSLIFSSINKKMEKKISYKLIYFNNNEATITLNIGRKIESTMLSFIGQRVQLKLGMRMIVSKKGKK